MVSCATPLALQFLPEATTRGSSLPRTSTSFFLRAGLPDDMSVPIKSMASPQRCLRFSSALKSALITPRRAQNQLPIFLVPAFSDRHHPFSTTSAQQSRIGRLSLFLPENVSFAIRDVPPSWSREADGKVTRRGATRTVDIRGPLGELSYEIPPFVQLAGDEGSATQVVSVMNKEDRKQREMWGKCTTALYFRCFRRTRIDVQRQTGTVRAYLHNYIQGVTVGHTAILRLVGVGYRASVEPTAVTKTAAYPGQKFVSLRLGYSHPIELGVPENVTASCPQPTRILLEGINKEVVKQFAAKIREWRKPEPYKGKGIFVNDETIKLKSKKIS